MKFDIDKDIGVHLPSPNGKGKSYCQIMVLSSFLVTGLIVYELYQKDYWELTERKKDASAAASQSYEYKLKSSVELARLQQQFSVLKKELIAMSRENSVQQATNKALNRKLQKVEDELTATRKKQLLYSDILAADNLSKGLHIRHFSIRRKEGMEAERRYHYTLVLSHAKSDKKIVKGQYVIRIEGKEEGKNISYTHRDLTADGLEAKKYFSLKYYQSLEGDIILPQAFVPEKVILWVIPKNKKLETQRQSYQWKPLINHALEDEFK